MRPTLNESTEIIETVIEMTFDRLGRRVWMREREDDTVFKEERFVYDGYLCVQRLDATQGNAVRTEFVWDPTESVATRPLAMRAKNWGLNLFYSHDGNKNVSEVFYHAPQNGIAAHYDYAPFGAVTRTSSATRFSSEYHDAPLSLVYYNYRHYNPLAGRWLGRDPLHANFLFVYGFLNNSPIHWIDFLGLSHIDDILQIRKTLKRCARQCPHLANWDNGLRFLDEYAQKIRTQSIEEYKQFFESITDSFSNTCDIEDLVDKWSDDPLLDEKFDKAIEALEDVQEILESGALIKRMQSASKLSPSEQVELLEDILKLQRKFPDLDYITSCVRGIHEGLERLEDMYTREQFEVLADTKNCSKFLQWLNWNARLGPMEQFNDALKKH